MKVYAYAIYDSKAEYFQRPFFAHTDGLASRAVADEGARSGTPLNAHPSDYQLFCIGEFDDYSGAISGFTPRSLGVVRSIISQHNEPSIEKLDKRPSNAIGDES